MSFLSRQCISLSIQFFTDTPLVFLFVFLYLYTLSFILLLTAVDCCGTPWTLCFGFSCCGRQRFYGSLWKYSLWNVLFLRHSRPRFFPAFFSFLFLYHTSPTLLLLPSRCGGLFFGSSSGIRSNDFPQLSTADYTDTFNELQALSTKAVHGGAIIKAVSII